MDGDGLYRRLKHGAAECGGDIGDRNAQNVYLIHEPVLHPIEAVGHEDRSRDKGRDAVVRAQGVLGASRV